MCGVVAAGAHRTSSRRTVALWWYSYAGPERGVIWKCAVPVLPIATLRMRRTPAGMKRFVNSHATPAPAGERQRHGLERVKGVLPPHDALDPPPSARPVLGQILGDRVLAGRALQRRAGDRTAAWRRRDRLAGPTS